MDQSQHDPFAAAVREDALASVAIASDEQHGAAAVAGVVVALGGAPVGASLHEQAGGAVGNPTAFRMRVEAIFESLVDMETSLW